MKCLVIGMFALMASASAFADFVYMKEDATSKSVVLRSDDQSVRTLNDGGPGVWALYPDVSADGNEVVFSEGAGQGDLHLTYKDLRKNLTQRFKLPQKGMLLHSKFSKNGKWIFYSAPGPQGKNVIWFFDRMATVEAQGTHLFDFSLENATMLSDEEAYFPRPSSDGNFVVYQRNSGGKKEIVLFDRIEGKKRVLAEGMSPALSFDERQIAYTAKADGNWNVYIIDRVSGAVRQLTRDPRDELAPTFRPDGTLVFASNREGQFQLFRLHEEKWEKLITEANADIYSPQFSGETGYQQKLRAPFIGTARSSFGTVAHEGKIYMAGGHMGAEHTYPPESFSDAFMVYDVASDAWRELAPRPRKAHGFQIAAFGNYVYAFGGFAYSADHKPRWKSLVEIDRYDIRTNTWETIGALAEPRSSNAAVMIDGKVYLVGGWNSTPKFDNDADGKFHDTIEVFDLATEKVGLASFRIPLPLRRAFTGIEHDGKILLIGGLGEGASHFELLNRVTEINPRTGETRELTPLPFATFAPAAEILKGELLVFGGMFKTGAWDYEYVSHVYGMSLNDKVWRHTGRSLKETKGFSQVFHVTPETLGILGGHHYSQGMDTPVRTFETIER